MPAAIWSAVCTRSSATTRCSPARAAAAGRTITDIRRAPPDLPVAAGRARLLDAYVVLTVGTDCNVGKMTAQLQLVRGLNARGLRTRFVATGQTGIMLEGWGIAVDAVVADFIAGAAERITLEGATRRGRRAGRRAGEHQPSRVFRRHARPAARLLPVGPHPLPSGRAESASMTAATSGSPIPPLADYVRWYEAIGSAVHPTRVIGISLNTYDLTEAAARAACDAAARATGLPATDPVRFDPAPLLDAVVVGRERHFSREKGPARVNTMRRLPRDAPSWPHAPPHPTGSVQLSAPLPPPSPPSGSHDRRLGRRARAPLAPTVHRSARLLLSTDLAALLGRVERIVAWDGVGLRALRVGARRAG